MSLSSLITVEPLDSFFFPDHRPFNQDDPGLGVAESRFPPPPHALAGAVRFAIARHLGFDDGSGDWGGFAGPDGLALGEELGSGPFAAGQLRFGPPLILDGEALLYPVPRTLVGRFDRWGELEELAFVRPGETTVRSDAPFGRLAEVKAPEPERFAPLDGWWLPKSALKRVLEGRLPAKDALWSPGSLMAERPRVGLATDYADHKARDGMLYAAAHGAFRQREDVCRHKRLARHER